VQGAWPLTQGLWGLTLSWQSATIRIRLGDGKPRKFTFNSNWSAEGAALGTLLLNAQPQT
jgi:hypothetical protein